MKLSHQQIIETKIYSMCGVQVMLDRDIAQLVLHSKTLAKNGLLFENG
jgi:hypothetical protein